MRHCIDWLRSNKFLLLLCAALTIASSSAGNETSLPAAPLILPRQAEAILDRYCLHCHDEDEQKGDIQLDTLEHLDLPNRLDLLNRMQEQLYFKHMPPSNKRQPTDDERKEILSFISAELGRHQASTLEGKLQKPEFGNYLDNAKLFSGEFSKSPAFTYDRRWLISEFIFHAKLQRILENETRFRIANQNVLVMGGNSIPNLSFANPFLLPANSGVRYYANEDLTGGHLSSMLTNAQKASEYITDYLVPRKKGKYLPAISRIMALEDEQAATLASRRAYLQTNIAQLCQEIYGDENESLLPTFIPVVLKSMEALPGGEKYKKAPIHVALGTIKKLDAESTLFPLLIDPANSGKSDDELRLMCERIWFFRGDFDRTIQARMAMLREYMPEFREHARTEWARKNKPVPQKPPAESELTAIKVTIQQHRNKGDTYGTMIQKCIDAWEKEFARQVIDAGPPSDALLSELIEQLSQKILERPLTESERSQYREAARSYLTKLGKLKGIQKLIQTFFLTTEFAYRQELGTGSPDEHGRRMLSPRDASYAIAYALTDQSPDPILSQAAASGKLNTRDDYRREVERMLKNRDTHYLIDPILADKHFAQNTTNLPIRKLRFFREFFGYPSAVTIFKDEKRFGLDRLDDATCRLVNETDRLVEHILLKDKNVFEELLTTEKFYVYHDGDNARMQAASDRIKRIYAYFKDLDWKNFKQADLLKHAEFLREVKMRGVNPDNMAARTRQGDTLQLFKLSMTSITARLDKGQKEAAPFDLFRGYGYDFMPAYNVAMFYNITLDNWDYATTQPATVAHRKGLLTSPAWLIAHAKNTETDPVHRGKWVREKLLAGTVPDVPISVDAVIPEDHNRTLRDRLASATETEYCWKCHKNMNPLGYAFESYDDFGRYRMQEFLEYPDKLIKKGSDKPSLLTDTRDMYQALPVNAKGRLTGTGDLALDGDVADAIDLTTRLAKARIVRQSILRHAFRYFMGRNEMLSDSKTLIDAENAYVSSGGSFDAVIVSLLTSDSFLYRKSP